MAMACERVHVQLPGVLSGMRHSKQTSYLPVLIDLYAIMTSYMPKLSWQQYLHRCISLM